MARIGLKHEIAYVKLSTEAVEKSVDGAGVSDPSARRAVQFSDLATK